MNSLSNIFNEIINDFTKEEYLSQRVLSRRFVFDNDIVIICYYNIQSHTKELAIRVYNNFDRNVFAKYPNWNGINVVISEIENGIDKGLYLSFQQLENYDDNIYDAIVEDLLENVKLLQSQKKIIDTVGKVLVKWKQFFIMHNELVMSDIRQQGLYSELIFLEKMIDKYGEKALNFWSGCNFETHDFYINGDAIEVKSTSINSSNRATISNEYQLDTNDVTDKLYLMFVALRRSQSDGETLSLFIQKILDKLDSNNALEVFEEKLFKYGYLLRNPEMYKIGFFKRETKYFQVLEEFPKITRSTLPTGISNVDYTLNLDGCDKFEILEEALIEKLKEV